MPDTEIHLNGLREPHHVARKFLARPKHVGVGAIIRRSI